MNENINRKTEGKSSLGRTTHVHEKNMKIFVKELGCENAD